MNEPPREERPTVAEERLLALLLLLRDERDPRNGALLAAVMRRVRWQRTLRDAARAIGDLALALADGLATIAGMRRDGRRAG